MKIRIALAGNPNCGKTTLFNMLTGSSQFVGNWPGVTVEKKEGKLKGKSEVIITDLPGIYSLSPYTLEEIVARKYLVGERPDAIINIVDGTNLERNLYLTTQLIELGIPVVIAINMMDVVRKNGDVIDIGGLSSVFHVPVVEISALKGEGVFAAADVAIEAAKSAKMKTQHIFSGEVEHALAHIEEATLHDFPQEKQRWYAIKLFERDERVIEELGISPETIKHIESDIASVEAFFDDDAEAIITNERYNFVTNSLKGVYRKKKEGELTLSDKIDKVVTNRWAALPIFAAIMFLVYFISVTTIGSLMTDFMNDVLFGEWIIPAMHNFLEAINCWAWLEGLIVDGIIGGVGAVLGFVPQMLVLFFFLAFLEASGYMSRIAFVMDKIFRKFGLSGKSFIPMLVGTGCSVPGIMASRTIENERDRRMTITTTSFIPCGAKLPVIALISGVMFGRESALVSTGAFFIGIAAVVISGLILKKTKLFAGDTAPFIMELPAYHMPRLKNLLSTSWERGFSFIKKAGTVILVSSVILWFLQSFGFDSGFKMVSDSSKSILAYVGKPAAFLFIPLGFGIWQAAIACATGLIAKENIVASFGIFYGIVEVAENGSEIWALMAADFTPLMALSFLCFNLLCAPCFAAIGAIRREMGSAKWTWFALGYQTLFAYVSSFIIYQLGSLFSERDLTLGGAFGPILAAVLILGVLYLIIRPEKRLDDKTKRKGV